MRKIQGKPVCGLVAAVFIAASGTARADLGFPDYLKFSPKIQLDPAQTLVLENLAEAEFQTSADGANVVSKRGVHYQRWLRYVAASGETPPGYYNGTEARVFAALAQTFVGWQTLYVAEDKSAFVMRSTQKGSEVWASVKMDAPQAQVNIALIEVMAAANTLVLAAPAATPETISDKSDFPFLMPYPGSTRKSAGKADYPLEILLPASGQSEAQLIGTGYLYRYYQGPSTLSNLQFISTYQDALSKAGWQVLYPTSEAGAKEAATLIAHYSKNNRDLWAKLGYEFGAAISYSVADVGAENWAAKFNQDCHIPLYGVFFDFNKATLKPESNSVLAKAALLLQQNANAQIEVQGHTDNIGTDAYNMELSSARAQAVATWLQQHGISKSRLSAKGYGKTQPVAENDTDAGRAKNRRVELRNLGCGKR